MQTSRYLAAGAALTLSLVACSGEREQVADDQEEAVDVNVTDQQVGDCLDDTGGIVVFNVPVVGCDTEHAGEVYALIQLEGIDEYDRDAIDEQGFERCIDEFEGYVGAPVIETTLFVSTLSPTESGWDLGDREVVCIAVMRDESTLNQSVEDASDDFAAEFDPALDASRNACIGGDDAACVDLFQNSPAGSDDEFVSLTCGGRDFSGDASCLSG